ncbi:MAG: RsmB/NOP family class I SAM-dependent RNA methyltransferase [Clostridia bacterium]|nr:RsmB/NOP family class I SAM-dependent RNA methyltransferase [Clostridia bacterium]
MKLPAEFEKRMQEMLGAEYDVFRAVYEAPHKRGIRLNTLKCTAETLAGTLAFPLENSPFSPLSYYAPVDLKMSALPLYHAGAFYSQEPSASSAVTLLDPQPGDKILDLCAAPGGKSTQIAALTGDTGLLWSNEVVRSRASILASNLERMGVRNAVVSSVYPDQLAEKLTGYFDKILVDAPCSGEGMFRRDEIAVTEWSPEHVETCAVRQLAILDSAAHCLREDGILVYSTCTFSMEENEGVVLKFLEAHPEFVLEKPHTTFGRPAYGVDAVRIFPMDGGEGHFAARFRRIGVNSCTAETYFHKPDKQTDASAQALYKELFTDKPGRFVRIKDRILMLPEEMPEISGLGVVRAGVEFGEVKKNRIEPAHGIFMAAKSETCRSVMELTHDDPRVHAFLRGEEIEAEDCKGYTAVSVEGVITGFGKASGGVLKNKYPKGLRIHI